MLDSGFRWEGVLPGVRAQTPWGWRGSSIGSGRGGEQEFREGGFVRGDGVFIFSFSLCWLCGFTAAPNFSPLQRSALVGVKDACELARALLAAAFGGRGAAEQ